jgi:ribosome biogenesis GTPase
MIEFDFESLRAIGLSPACAQQLVSLQADAGLPARVTEVQRDWVTLHDGRQSLQARAPADGHIMAVGDWVIAQPIGDGSFALAHRMEAVTRITRRAHGGRRQVLVSNVDTALLVMGLDHDFNLRRLERYLAIVQAAGVEAVIVLTKADASPDREEKIAALHARLPQAPPLLAVDARDSAAAAALQPWLGAARTLVLLGSSGAGKSTLTNTLCGAALATGAVREDDSRGRHTTTSRTLHRCPGGACIVDTPGLRSWSPDLDEQDLYISFDDIAALAGQCQFRDCSHGAEPGCAVRGQVDEDRLANYFKLQREMRRHAQTALDRIADRQRWKSLMKQAGERSRSKRGG